MNTDPQNAMNFDIILEILLFDMKFRKIKSGQFLLTAFYHEGIIKSLSLSLPRFQQ
jgi:hypothetical protein